MARVFRPSNREAKILSRIESSKERAQRLAIDQLRDVWEPLSNATAMKLIEEKLIETTSKEDIQEQIGISLQKLTRADDFDIDYQIAPFRSLVPRPNPVSLYLTAFYSQAFGKYTWSVDLRYLHQQDVGNQLAGEISTYMAGGNISLGVYGAYLTLYYGLIGSDSLVEYFGENKIISLQNLELDRAEEKGFAVKVGYNFENLGVNGLSMYVVYGNFDTPDRGFNGSPDAEEFDVNLQYQLGGWLKDCSLRVRYAIIELDEDLEGGRTWTDTRFYLVYSF